MPSELGLLLVDAGLISDAQLSKAQHRSISTGLPACKLLALNGDVEEQVIANALEIQLHLRDAMVTREDAVAVLRLLAQPEESMTGAEKLHLQSFLTPQRRCRVRVGELMVMAGRLCETDVLVGLETALQSRLLIGQVLVQTGYLSQDCLDIALQLQSKVGANELESLEAAELLRIERFEPN